MGRSVIKKYAVNPSINFPIHFHGNGTLIETIIVCNRDNTDGIFTIALCEENPIIDSEDYIYYEHAIEANQTLYLNLNVFTPKNGYLIVYSNKNITYQIIG